MTIFGLAGLILVLSQQAKAQRVDLAQCAAATLVALTDKPADYENWYQEIAQTLEGYHALYEWHTKAGVTFCVIPFGGGGNRLTYNFSTVPFCASGVENCQRQVEARLLNVPLVYRRAVWWAIFSDVAGGEDANRQLDHGHKTRDGDTITVVSPNKGDRGFYLAGRWEGSIGKRDFCRANPSGGVLLILR